MIDPERAIELAKQFHDAYEKLAPSFGYETRHDTKQFDPETPNGKLMAAVCREVCEPLEIQAYKAGVLRGYTG